MDDVGEEEEEEQDKTMLTYLRFWSGGKANPIETRGVAVRGAPGHLHKVPILRMIMII